MYRIASAPSGSSPSNLLKNTGGQGFQSEDFVCCDRRDSEPNGVSIYQYPLLLYTVDHISRYCRRRVQRESLCSTRNTSLSGPIVTVQDYRCTQHSWQDEKQRWKCQGASPGSRLARGGKQRYMSLDRPDMRRHQGEYFKHLLVSLMEPHFKS
jgi:hypothetical protein